MEYITYWMGRRIEDLSREELIAALSMSVRETQQARETHRRSDEMHAFFRKVRAA